MGLAVVVPLVAIGLAVALWRGWVTRRVWIVVVGLQALLVASAVVAMQSGERDEETAEQVVAETAIEAHEEAAVVFTWVAAATLALAAAALAPKHAAARNGLATAAALATVVVALLGVRVGHAGGELVYRHGAASAHVAVAGAAAPATPEGAVGTEAPAAAAERTEAEEEDD